MWLSRLPFRAAFVKKAAASLIRQNETPRAYPNISEGSTSELCTYQYLGSKETKVVFLKRGAIHEETAHPYGNDGSLEGGLHPAPEVQYPRFLRAGYFHELRVRPKEPIHDEPLHLYCTYTRCFVVVFIDAINQPTSLGRSIE